ncbi:MAG: hypothetical protein ACOYNP_19065, partial [Gemmataceae bacterium]
GLTVNQNGFGGNQVAEVLFVIAAMLVQIRLKPPLVLPNQLQVVLLQVVQNRLSFRRIEWQGHFDAIVTSGF